MYPVTRLTTRSGAVYLFDEENSRIQRQSGEMNPGLRLPNAQWQDVYAHEVEEGYSARFLLGGGYYRVTTPVVSIERGWMLDDEVKEIEAA